MLGGKKPVMSKQEKKLHTTTQCIPCIAMIHKILTTDVVHEVFS